jgi:hypothetical protein
MKIKLRRLIEADVCLALMQGNKTIQKLMSVLPKMMILRIKRSTFGNQIREETKTYFSSSDEVHKKHSATGTSK